MTNTTTHILRVVQINDVYELDNLARLSTAIQQVCVCVCVCLVDSV